MKSLKDYLNECFNQDYKSLNNYQKNRMQELSGLRESRLNKRYAIQITVELDEEELILENEQYKKFKKSTALYYKHPEDKNIPVKAHYHVVDSRSKKEIYAVNVDGTAHHRKNKGFEVPKKHAEELSKLGANFKDGNLLENYSISTDNKQSFLSFLIILEE